MKYRLLTILTLILPLLTFAQEKGLDERVNDAFMPFATWWEGFVLTAIPIGEIQYAYSTYTVDFWGYFLHNHI